MAVLIKVGTFCGRWMEPKLLLPRQSTLYKNIHGRWTVSVITTVMVMDILWRNSATGMNFMYLMDGASIKSRYALNVVTAGRWELVGNGDFNGDGIGDVMWRNVEREHVVP